MGKKGVEGMIDEIEMFIENCKYQPLSNNKVVVPKDELLRMLNELKMKLPSEIERCKKIMRNKEAILASARTRSDAIISESVNEANRLVETNHITELANARAEEIVRDAREQAQQIVDDANAEAAEVRLGAMNYTKQKLSDMRDFFAATLAADRENYTRLVDSLESSVFTLESNMGEVDNSIALMTGAPIPQAERESGLDGDFDYDEYDEDLDEDEDDDDLEYESDDEDEEEDEDFDLDDDDFLNE